MVLFFKLYEDEGKVNGKLGFVVIIMNGGHTPLCPPYMLHRIGCRVDKGVQRRVHHFSFAIFLLLHA